MDPAVPQVVAAKFGRAQKLFFLGWLDVDLIKAGELVTLTALELALRDRYLKNPEEKPGLASLLKRMVKEDGLTDDPVRDKPRRSGRGECQQILIAKRCGTTVVSHLIGETKPSLADIRNSLAYGDPLEGSPWSGLFELIRDLIHYVYRDRLSQPAK